TARTPAPIDSAAEAVRQADALFGEDTGGGPAIETARRRPSGDLEQQLTDLRNTQARASLEPSGGRELPRGAGPQLGTTDEPPVPNTPGELQHTAPPPDERDHARVVLTPPPKPPPGDPSIDGIIGKIKTSYMSGLVRCYKKAMAGTGAMSGKVVLAFTVSDHGAVGDASAKGVDDGLEQCVESLMATWRFVPVVDGDGDATEVDVKLTLQLRPD
ncbi:MAG TPA: hypothetical protein VHE35_13005, partial [Kofleriaceae bacterium]|nr:hypothetical protein [Kofleriaceae bacterium]